ncbi:MAG: hypothetical protein J6U54_05205 [Clostridiales bacterium]|nr:hypothetical protein [Clostridiales bacterium]
MFDFVRIVNESTKRGVLEIYPDFLTTRSRDLMIRGGKFYAVWDEESGYWTTDEYTVSRVVDEAIKSSEAAKSFDGRVVYKLLKNFSSRKWKEWQLYCSSLPDNYHELDEKITFLNDKIKKTDYVSKRLTYSIEEGDISAYEELMDTLYDPEERQKLEWAIGAVITGDSRKIQKFIVLYGAAGTGKSTVLNIIQKLFDGYYSTFEAKALASNNNSFALEAFVNNPLVAIQHDGDLSKIEDNTKLNSIVSHEYMMVNEKYKSQYSSRFNSFLFMGTNKPVRITDAKSGIIRRLIDVSPSGRLIPSGHYEELMDEIFDELGAIAYHCREVYQEMGPNYYNKYRPNLMMGATNDFYNFMEDNFDFFKKNDGVSLIVAWTRYKDYCDEAKISYPYNRRVFKEELKNYFREVLDRSVDEHGARVRNYYNGFLVDKFNYDQNKFEPVKKIRRTWLDLKEQKSILDKELADCPAQYANSNEKPAHRWDNVKTTLKDIDTSQLHYVRAPENHIFIDFDLKDENGNKSFELNKEAALKWPKTYAETSKGGEGIHLHYLYPGDPSRLSVLFDEGIEIKTCLGKSSIRRKLVRCNNAKIATISDGLPLKGGKNVINYETVKSEKILRKIINDCLDKKHHGATKPEVDFIYKILNDAYNQTDFSYDVSDLRPKVLAFALNSSHQADICVKTVSKMKFMSEELESTFGRPQMVPDDSEPIIFFDVEVFPNLFLLNWKKQGDKNKVVRMINPTPAEVEELTKYRLVGFNNRRYDNHILYARIMGYSEAELFKLSQKLIEGSANATFGEAFNISYTDVYDFCSKKQSLKKWEIELGIHHQELGLPWDLPVPEDMWVKVAEYCDNDVIATEAVFNNRQQDFIAREILAKISLYLTGSGSVNDTTNQLTTRIIVRKDPKPQEKFIYPDLSKTFPGYIFDAGKSYYRGFETGEGGFVYSNPGMYKNVKTFDIASMHPSSLIAENGFGPFTENFKLLLDIRLNIKHKNYDAVKDLFDGLLSSYLTSDKQAKALSYALKIAINSVYGLTAAGFPNKLRDPRNIDNWVAKRGALFMIDLYYAVKEKGYNVIHIKTDSIKIEDPDEEIERFVFEFGRKYGYTFEVEAIFNRLCLVNDAVYIARYTDDPVNEDHAGKWGATGAQFAQPFVFKTLFSNEPIDFKDMCETKTVTSALYLDFNEGLKEGEHNYHFVGRAGQFCPIIPGKGGAELLREKDGKYSAATGTKGYRWLESEYVKEFGMEDCIDKSYYISFVEGAVETISEFGDFEWFVSDDNSDIPEEVPFADSKVVGRIVNSKIK